MQQSARLFLFFVFFQLIFQCSGTLYGLLEKLHPRDVSHLGSINTRNGDVAVLENLDRYGSSVGGSTLDLVSGTWFVMYSLFPSVQIEIACQMVQINLTSSSDSTSVNVTEAYCPWGLAWSSNKSLVYGVSWNVRLGLQEAVTINPKTGQTSLLTEFPKKYGNVYGNSRLVSLDDVNEIFYVVLDGFDYLGQFLYAVDMNTGSYKEYILNKDDSEWIVTSMTWDPALDCFVGIGYHANRGWWEFIHVSSTAKITAINHFDDSDTKFIYEYNIFWLDEGSQDYYLLVSDLDQENWYIYTFDSKTGFIIGKSLKLDCNDQIPDNQCIPNHITLF